MPINIKSFSEFSKFKTEQEAIALENEQNLKREENASTFKNLLSEYGVDSISSLSREQKQEFYSRLEEGNAFGNAVRKAKEAGEKEFEFEGKTYKVEESLVSEAIQVDGKRDAKKVVTQYNKIFNKSLVDFGAMTTESILGCIKYLMSEALHDANFHREAEPTAKMIKGNIRPLEIKMPGLGGHFVKIGPKTIKEILDKYYSDIASAAGWGGIGIVEGTALYLEQIKQEAMGQAALNKFNTMFEGEDVRINVEARINEAKVLEAAAWEIGKDYPSYGVVVGVTQDGDICEVSFDTGEKIVFRDTGSKWVQESVVTEGRVKQFEMDLEDMIKEIKRGYGWIDPEFVEDTWENMSDSIDFELVKEEIYKRLIAAGLLAYADDENEEEAGKYIKSLKELGIKESVVTEAKFVKDFNRDVLDAKTKEEVLELYPNAEFFIGKSDHFFGELDGNLFFKAYYTKAQKEFEIKSVYSEKGSNYVHLYNESVFTESDEPKCSNKKGHLYKQVDKDGTVECVHCGLRNSLSESAVTENYEVIYSDVTVQMKKFRNKRQALDFMNKEIASNKKLRNIAVYKPGMHSTTQTELVVKFWGEGSYLDNVSKRDEDLAAKKLKESAVTEARYNKKSLLKKLGSADDAMIQTGNGKEYIIYNPDSNNDDNAAMWHDKSVFAVDQDGEELEIAYKDIELVMVESAVTEAEIKSDDEFQEYAFTVLKNAFGDDFDEAKAQEVVDVILSKSDGDYGAAVGMLTSSLG